MSSTTIPSSACSIKINIYNEVVLNIIQFTTSIRSVSTTNFSPLETFYFGDSNCCCCSIVPNKSDQLSKAAIFFLMLHLKFMHLNYFYLKKGIQSGAIKGFPYDVSTIVIDDLPPCEVDVISKSTAVPRSKASAPTAAKPGVLFHADTKGPFQTRSIHGNYYWGAIIDHYSRKGWLYPLKHKSETMIKMLKRWQIEEFLPMGVHACTMTFDQGGEYVSDTLIQMLYSMNIRPQWIPSKKHRYQGMIENYHKFIMNLVRPTLKYWNLPNYLWDELAITANYVRNHSPLKPDFVTPEYMWNGTVQDASLFHVPGSVCYYHECENKTKGSLADRSERVHFLGYTDSSRSTFKVWRPSTGAILLTRDIEFREQPLLLISPHQPLKGHDLSTVEVPTELEEVHEHEVPVFESKLPRPFVGVDTASSVAGIDTPRSTVTPDAQLLLLTSYQEGLNNVDAGTSGQIGCIGNYGHLGDVPGPVGVNVLHLAPCHESQQRTDSGNSRSIGVNALTDDTLSGAIDAEPLKEYTKSGDRLDLSCLANRKRSMAKCHPRKQRSKLLLTSVTFVCFLLHLCSFECQVVEPLITNYLEQEELVDVLNNLVEISKTLDEEDFAAGVYKDPSTHAEAMRSPEKDYWQEAMDEEVETLTITKTWRIVDIPPGANLLKSKWVYKRKTDKNNNLERYRARLVAKGYSQKHGVDYDEIFAPVIRHSTMRMVLSLCAHYGLHTRHLDVPKAFPQADIDFDCYMAPPAGVRLPKGKCFQLLKSIYGLKQAARLFNQKISSYLVNEMEMEQMETDTCVFYKYSDDGAITLVTLYVDDIVVATSNDRDAQAIVDSLKEKFNTNDLGPLEYILGMRVDISDDRHRIRISQDAYVTNMLNELGLQDLEIRNVPMRPNIKLSKEMSPQEDSEKERMSHIPYRKAIGKLIYLTISTRPDIAFAVNQCARFMSDPGMAHWEAVLDIFRYLKGTKDLGITYTKNPNQDVPILRGYCDSDWASNDPDTHKSISGTLFMMSGGPISWKSHLQHALAMSSMEAEYYAMGDSAKEAIGLRQVHHELDPGLTEEHYNTPTEIFADSQSAIQLANNPVFHHRSKHIALREHFVRKLIVDRVLIFNKIHTDDNIADIFTKPLAKAQFQRLRALLMGA